MTTGNKDNPKTKVLYDKKDPYRQGVTFVAIQTETIPPYVWDTYSGKKEYVPDLPSDMLVVPVKAAKKLFDFQKGKLEDVVRE